MVTRVLALIVKEYLARLGGMPPTGEGAPSMGQGAGSVNPPTGAEAASMTGTMAGAGSGTSVWVKTGNEIRPVPVQLGSNDGDNAEVISGLSEGDEVVVRMTVATSAEKKEKEVASNPFMPTPPGRRNTQGSSRTGANSSTRTQQ